MKKVIFFLMTVLFLTSCSNSIVGTWISTKSDSAVNDRFNIGTVQYHTFNSDGSYENKMDLQASLDGDNTALSIKLTGKWEIQNEDKLIVHVEKAIINGQESPNVKDVDYSIVENDGDNLKLMTGGKEITWKRKK